MRLIDADELERVAVTVGGRLVVHLTDIHSAPTVEITDYDTGYQDGLEDGLNDIRPQGEWICVTGDVCECSNCRDREIPMSMMSCTYCPSCGALMRGEADNDHS